MHGQSGGVAGGALGGAVTLLFNYVVSALWQIIGMPPLIAPTSEVLGAEQIVVAALFTWWMSKDRQRIGRAGDQVP